MRGGAPLAPAPDFFLLAYVAGARGGTEKGNGGARRAMGAPARKDRRIWGREWVQPCSQGLSGRETGTALHQMLLWWETLLILTSLTSVSQFL